MDDRNSKVPGARYVADVLSGDPLFRWLGWSLAYPLVLGVVLALLALLIVIVGPTTESRFIYTDF